MKTRQPIIAVTPRRGASCVPDRVRVGGVFLGAPAARRSKAPPGGDTT